MDSRTLHERFEAFADDYLKFDAIESPRHRCPDICAFLMLADLLPELTGDIVTASEHDEFYLGIDCDRLDEVATDAQIRDLVRCGVMHSEEYESLSMFA